MLWLVGIGLLLFGVLGYLLIAPIYIEVDSLRGFFRMRFHRLASASLIETRQGLDFRWQIAGWGKTQDVFSWLMRTSNPTQDKEKKARISRKKMSHRRFPLKKIWAMLRTFHVQTCEVNLDTGDMPTNGMLYPAAMWLSAKTHRNVRINFIGENEVVLKVENRLGRILWAFMTGK